jgi:hypothetical protein
MPHRGILFIKNFNRQQPELRRSRLLKQGNSYGVYIINPFICYKQVAPPEPLIS